MPGSSTHCSWWRTGSTRMDWRIALGAAETNQAVRPSSVQCCETVRHLASLCRPCPAWAGPLRSGANAHPPGMPRQGRSTEKNRLNPLVGAGLAAFSWQHHARSQAHFPCTLFPFFSRREMAISWAKSPVLLGRRWLSSPYPTSSIFYAERAGGRGKSAFLASFLSGEIDPRHTHVLSGCMR